MSSTSATVAGRGRTAISPSRSKRPRSLGSTDGTASPRPTWCRFPGGLTSKAAPLRRRRPICMSRHPCFLRQRRSRPTNGPTTPVNPRPRRRLERRAKLARRVTKPGARVALNRTAMAIQLVLHSEPGSVHCYKSWPPYRVRPMWCSHLLALACTPDDLSPLGGNLGDYYCMPGSLNPTLVQRTNAYPSQRPNQRGCGRRHQQALLRRRDQCLRRRRVRVP